MSKSNRTAKNRLNSIHEEFEKPDLKDKDYQFANFRDYIKTDDYKSKLIRRAQTQSKKKSLLDDKELNFLTQNATLLNLKQKTNEIDQVIQTRRDLASLNQQQHLASLRTKLTLNRNPNIQNLLQDVRTKSSINQLQEELKNEFDLFLNASFNQSAMSKKPGWNFLTLGDYVQEVSEEVKKPPIESKPELNDVNNSNSINTATFDNNNQNQMPSTTKSAPTSNKKSAKSTVKEKQAQNEKANNKTEIISNMQVAIIGTKSKPIIELNKMLESIKRIDLPKFQPELLQICQYGQDAQLLNFYPQDLDNDLNNKQNSLGRYCIHECCVKGNVKMLKGLLQYIDDVNKVDANMQTAAHIAAKYGELECLKILYANGIDLDLADKFGMQASHIAAQQNHSDILEFFFEIGLSFSTGCHKGKVPFHYAAEYGAFESVKLLEKYYNDISIADNEGNTVAHLAAINDHLKCVKYLCSLGLPVDKVRNHAGRNVAHVCCLSGSLKTLHWLLENSSDRLNIDNSGNTLAHTSCLGGQAECFHCCVQHDVPVNQLNMYGESPLDLARRVGKANQIAKAARNQIRCEYCVRDALRLKWEKENEKASDNKICMSSAKSAKEPRKQSSMSKSVRLRSSVTEPDAELSRDFVAQYFGPEI